mmetsp:Transcript_26885/g.64135  ORF Transcript_26885/g.64135 Transcript_26885/m.64135 type:complete len:672 (-) Transcript_26885:135-2150(-)
MMATAAAAAASSQVQRHRQNADGPRTQTQSRPIIIKKKVGFFQRWMSGATSSGRSLRERCDSAATAATVSSITSSVAAASASKKKTMMKTTMMTDTTSTTMAKASTQDHVNTGMVYSSPTSSDLMPFLEKECPRDLVAQILTYVGPQTVQTLNRTNSFFHNLIKEESTWRAMCEGLYKWKDGDDVPSSWKEFYRCSPCVPVDYKTIHSALGVFESVQQSIQLSNDSQRQKDGAPEWPKVRILLRPGRYVLREPILVDDYSSRRNSLRLRNGSNGSDSKMEQQDQTPIVRLELETVTLPEALYPTPIEAARRSNSFSPSILNDPPKRRKKGAAKLRYLLNGCRRMDAVVDMEDDDLEMDNDDDIFMLDEDGVRNNGSDGRRAVTPDFQANPPIVLDRNMTAMEALELVRRHNATTAAVQGEVVPQDGQDAQSSSRSSKSDKNSGRIRQATLVLRTRRHNAPLIRVRQGSIAIRNIVLAHASHGTDIWNGNAAVQIQPPMGPGDQPLAIHPAPTATLDRVDVTSASGRGIVNIDGGHVTMNRCYVHDCAATGIYVGGPGSKATIERTDVVRNGNGNTQHRRGVARGHSGIYLEQGNLKCRNSNISQNALTGISAVSPENAILNLEQSDLMSNGTHQLELPGPGTPAHRRSVNVNNNFSSTGLARSRSGLVSDE